VSKELGEGEAGRDEVEDERDRGGGSEKQRRTRITPTTSISQKRCWHRPLKPSFLYGLE